MRYRSDIDGLRALAVLSVVLFHASVPYFTGGFVGVDFFFVISGYLITSIILKDVEKNQFSYKLFWEKRIRRIFPAALACLSLTAISTLFILSPTDLIAFGKSLFANGFFSSNVYFWKSSDYFNEVTEFFPLLHTWSLSIEEQFYLFLPMTLIVLKKTLKENWDKALVLLVFMSFGLCIWGTEIRPVAAFYLLPTRAWELGVGSLLALFFKEKPFPKGNLSQVFGLLGMVLLLYPVFAFNKETIFPGVSALIPVLGSALFIMAEGSVVNRLLGTKIFVAIGKISYSLYLWHWVCLVTMRNIFIVPPTLAENVIAIIISLILSILSFYFVEQPFRNNTGYWNRSKILGLFGISTVFYLLFGLIVWMGEGLPQRFGGAFVDYKKTSPIFKHTEICKIKEGVICKTAESKPSVREIFLWGDSHGQAVAGALQKATKELNLNFTFSIQNGCPPLLGAWPKGFEHRNCSEHNQKVFDYIKENRPYVIIVGRFDIYFSQRELSEASQKKEMVLASASFPNPKKSKEVSLKIIEESFKRVQKEEIDFSVFLQPPSFHKNPVELGNKVQIFGGNIALSREIQELYDRTNPFRFIVENLNIKAYDPYPILCDDSQCSAFNTSGQSLYFDDDHLSIHGGEVLVPSLVDFFLEFN
jgi:peptidoglycan/LPS O-acetylase OafA/YrhL